ncbi:type VI secretion system baseplate subunit TssG [Inquilinus sp. CA228]|uniref:type VI secretion system baseplate subunit TssG n=1 Tax=Inquilinus sp. CA228 TaxID=3455609 RepID=UPI003F8D41D3
MADANRIDAANLTAAPFSFDFFRAVAVTEEVVGGGALIGQLGPAQAEVVRFHTHSGFEFPASEIVSAEVLPAAEGGPVPERLHLTITFFGLNGTVSPLPTHYAESLLFTVNDNTRDLFDLFNHRLISLLYRIWRKYRFELKSSDSDVFISCLLALAGIPAERRGDAGWLQADRVLGILPHAIHWCRSPASMAVILRHWFEGIPFRIVEFERREVSIDPSQLWALGSAALDGEAVLGDVVEDIAGSFRVVCGPLDRGFLMRLLPDGEDYGELIHILRFLSRDAASVVLQLTLKWEELTGMTLGSDDDRLSFCGWLGRPDVDDEIEWPCFVLEDL